MSDNAYDVQKFVSYRRSGSRRQFLVQWGNSWVNEEDLLGCEDLITDFFKNNKTDLKEETDEAEDGDQKSGQENADWNKPIDDKEKSANSDGPKVVIKDAWCEDSGLEDQSDTESADEDSEDEWKPSKTLESQSLGEDEDFEPEAKKSKSRKVVDKTKKDTKAKKPKVETRQQREALDCCVCTIECFWSVATR